MVNVLVVEDDVDCLNRIADYINSMVEEKTILKVTNAEDAEKCFNSFDIDLFLIDIVLPDKSGFDIAGRVRDQDKYSLTPIIFITGEDNDYKTVHREFHNYDYINKPFTEEYFFESLQPLVKSLSNNIQHDEIVIAGRRKVIPIATSRSTIYLEYSKLLFVEVVRKELTLYTENNKVDNIKMSLMEFINLVDEPSFCRCHKSYALNTNKVDQFHQVNYQLWEIWLQGVDSPCYMSKTYYSSVVSKVNKL